MDIDTLGRAAIDEVLAKHFNAENLLDMLRNRRSKLSRGVDRVDADAFEKSHLGALNVVVRKVYDETFRFSPYLEKLVTKGRGKEPRVIARPTVRDKLVLWAMKDALHEMFPERVPSKLPNQVVREFVACLRKSRGQSIIKVDIASFYDSINREMLLGALGRILESSLLMMLVQKSIESPIVPPTFRKSELDSYEQKRGVPQGLPTSNFLAHLYLGTFDDEVASKQPAYFRYVDDILLIVPQNEVEAAEKFIEDRLKEIGLKSQERKSKSYLYAEQFEFLGYEVVGGKVRPKRSSVDKFIRSIAALFNGLRRKSLPRRGSFDDWSDMEFAEVFIEELNEMITGAISKGRQYGWVFYFNESNDHASFSLADEVVRKFARRTDLLTNDQRTRIKRCVRAVHETRHSKGAGYVKDYDKIVSVSDKRSFLMRYGYLRESDALGPKGIEERYDVVLQERLHKLERDVGFIS